MDDIWYYAEGEKIVGPVTFGDLTSILYRVSGAGAVLVRRPDFADWKAASAVPELARHIFRPPPLPKESKVLISPSIEPVQAPTMVQPSDSFQTDSNAEKIIGIGAGIKSVQKPTPQASKVQPSDNSKTES